MLWPNFGTHPVFGQLELTQCIPTMALNTLIMAKTNCRNFTMKRSVLLGDTPREKWVLLFISLGELPTVVEYSYSLLGEIRLQVIFMFH